MKIAFVYENNGLGGAQKMLSWVAKNCLCGNDVYFITCREKRPSIQLEDGINCFSLTKPYERTTNKVTRQFVYISRLSKVFNIIKPEVICAFGVESVMYSCLAKDKHCRIIGSERRSPADMKRIWIVLSKVFYGRCTTMVFQTNDARDFYGKRIREHSVVIPNPYISTASMCKPVLKSNRNKHIVCAAARYEYEKGFDVAIKAFSIIHEEEPDYQLFIYAGEDNSEKERCKKIIMSLGLDDYVHLEKPIRNIAKEITDCAVFLLPSRTEGIPNILLEVLGEGIPTVSCDCPPGGPRLLTDNGKRGYLVPVDSYEEMAKKALDIIQCTEISNSLSSLAVGVREEFSENNIAEKWKAILL